MPPSVCCCSRAIGALFLFGGGEVFGCFVQGRAFVFGELAEAFEFRGVGAEKPAMTVAIGIYPASATPGAQRFWLMPAPLQQPNQKHTVPFTEGSITTAPSCCRCTGCQIQPFLRNQSRKLTAMTAMTAIVIGYP